MLRRGLVLGLLAGVAVSNATPARAESGAYCSDADILEVFPGATGCEDADYIVLRLHDAFDVSVRFALSDACGRHDAEYWHFGGAVDGGADSIFLAATPRAAEVLGITPDFLLDEDSPLALTGGEVSTCSDYLDFGPNTGTSSPPDGQALVWANDGWESREPRPVNSQGEIGTLTGCGPADGGTPLPVEPLVCPEPEPEPVPEPVATPMDGGEPEPPTGPESSPGGDPVTPDPAETPEPTEPEAPAPSADPDAPSTDVPNENAEPEPTSADGAEEPETRPADGEQESEDRRDAGGGGTELSGVGDDAASGCDCRVASPQTPRSALLLGLPLLVLWYRRRT
jgi:hypothetical protein